MTPHSRAIAVAAVLGAVSSLLADALARDITLIPLLVLHAPATVVMLALHVSSPIGGAAMGAATFAAYTASVLSARSKVRRASVLALLGVVHVGCLWTVMCCAPWFGL